MAGQTETVIEAILAAIDDGRIGPGDVIDEQALIAQHGVSRTPVREALNRLIADGLVSFEPGRGFFARRLSVSEMSDLFAVRLDLESGALRRLLKDAETERLKEFAVNWRTMLARAEEMDLDALVAADEAFHLEIASIDGNKLTIDFEKAGQKRVLDGFVERV